MVINNMRKYPQVKKISDFDLLECLTHNDNSLDERGILTTILYQTTNYQLLSRYYVYKRKTVISIHDRTGYTLLNEEDVSETELYEIFQYIKNDGLTYISGVINGSLSEELCFTGYSILGAYMQSYFRYLINSDLISNERAYCVTFQTGNITTSNMSLGRQIKLEIISKFKQLLYKSNPYLSKNIQKLLDKLESTDSAELPTYLTFKDVLHQEILDTTTLFEEYSKKYITCNIFKKLFYRIFKITPTFDEYIKSITNGEEIDEILYNISDLAEDSFSLDLNKSNPIISPLIHTRNITLIKDDIFEINKKYIKSNKYVLSYLLDIDNKIPLELFYLFLVDYRINSNNKLNVDILTAIFREYLSNTYENNKFGDSNDDITYEHINYQESKINFSLYEKWVKNKFSSSKLANLIPILLTNTTKPYHTHRYHTNTYCIVGSELAFDYYYKIMDYLDIKPYYILRIRKDCK